MITFAIETVHVIGLSMYPTLDNDDLLIASKIDYHFHPPQRGDIVILKPPFGQNDLIKRVVGLPGDRFVIRDGHVYINGKALTELYINPCEPWTVNANTTEQVVPNGYFFVMGDNRNHSSDSRAFGPIRNDDIEARAWIRIWPLNKFGFVGGYPSSKPKCPTQNPEPAARGGTKAGQASTALLNPASDLNGPITATWRGLPSTL